MAQDAPERTTVPHSLGQSDRDLVLDATDLAALIGEHDFTSFETTPSTRLSKVRTIHVLDVFRPPLANDTAGAEVWVEVEGNGFLYNMVRIIAGSLVMVGAGRRSPEWLATALAARNRPAAGPTAPPQGLVLESIDLGDAWPR